jgi:hypothetical protein
MPQIELPAIETMNDRCTHCGQRIRLQRKEMLNTAKVRMLKRAAEHVMSTMKNDFMTKDFTDDNEYKLYSNFQHLRYHGLIAHVKVNGQKVRKHWLITKNGWAFLRGDIDLPKYVLVKDDHTQSRADKKVYLKDLLHGEPYVQTSFEYFDDDGNPVGIRPHYPQTNDNQGRLI